MTPLAALVAEELGAPVASEVTALAVTIALRHGDAARAVLFYGSCLREARFDGLLLDFYLIVAEYRAAYGPRWLAIANRLIPPNVFPLTSDGLAAKYAVLSEADFAALCGPEAQTASVWARFAQPSRLVWAADAQARARTLASVARCAPTLLDLARPMDPIDPWRTGFALTYAAELRAESAMRPGAMVDADPGRYARFSDAIPVGAVDRQTAERRWADLRSRGKRASILRLVKASMTFAGGIDYLAWKVNRHTGAAIALRPWQRRFPVLGGLTLLPRLLRSGAIR